MYNGLIAFLITFETALKLFSDKHVVEKTIFLYGAETWTLDKKAEEKK
jgi:hypothetical protein